MRLLRAGQRSAPPLNCDVMRHSKRVVFVALLLPLVALGQSVRDGTTLSVFGSDIRLPGECNVVARAIVDETTRLHCRLDSFESYTVIVWKAAACSTQGLQDSSVATVRYDAERNGRRYVEAVAGSIVSRQIYDAEVCLTVSASSERRLDEVLRPLWF